MCICIYIYIIVKYSLELIDKYELTLPTLTSFLLEKIKSNTIQMCMYYFLSTTTT